MQNDTENQHPDTDETDILPPPPKIKSYHEGLQSLKDVQAFLKVVNSLMNRVMVINRSCHSVKHCKQSTLEDFL